MRTERWRSRRWDQMSVPRRMIVMAMVALQVSLAVSAWTDLATRPAHQVAGRKRTWAAIIAINFVGPLLYFWRGRRRSG